MPPPNPTAAPRGGGVWREDVALERIAADLGARPGSELAPAWGDDAVVLGEARLALCTDAAVLGVHLDGDVFPVEDLGFRAAVAALSDLAAVGAAPIGVLAAVCAPGDVDVVAVAAAVADAAATAGCGLLGGDLSRAPTPTVVATAVGTVARAVPRDGAGPDEAVYVTGPLGASAAGLRRRREGAGLDDPLVVRHRRPRARVAEGRAAAAHGATAMLDVSDGLARDLRRLAAASGVGLAIDEVPVAEGATLADALGGGEDYELVVTCGDEGALRAGFAAGGLAAPLRIGTTTGAPGVLTLGGAALPDVGWRHGG